MISVIVQHMRPYVVDGKVRELPSVGLNLGGPPVPMHTHIHIVALLAPNRRVRHVVVLSVGSSLVSCLIL